MMHCDSNELKSSSVSNLHSNILFWVASLQCVQYVTQTGLWSLVLVFMCHSRLSALDSPCSLWKGLNFSPGKTEQMCQFLFKSHTHTHTRKNESINSFHVKDGKLNTCIIFHHLNCKSHRRLQAVKKKFYGICAKNNTGPKKTSKQYDNKTRYYCQPYSV